MDNYWPVNVPFLNKVLKWVVSSQLQGILDEMDYLDPFQFGFKPGYGMKLALVAVVDDLHQELEMWYVSLLVLLDLSVAFDTTDHVIFLGWDLGALFYSDFSPSKRRVPRR